MTTAKETTLTLPVKLPDHLVKMIIEQRELRRKRNRKLNAMNESIWIQIYKEYPELNEEDDHIIDTQYLDQGLALLKEEDNCVRGILGGLIKSTIK